MESRFIFSKSRKCMYHGCCWPLHGDGRVRSRRLGTHALVHPSSRPSSASKTTGRSNWEEKCQGSERANATPLVQGVAGAEREVRMFPSAECLNCLPADSSPSSGSPLQKTISLAALRIAVPAVHKVLGQLDSGVPSCLPEPVIFFQRSLSPLVKKSMTS